ncbi:MAG: hypothetical protein WBV25_08220, partial [Methylocella sp.]
LQAASLTNVFAWRADTRTAFWKNTRVVSTETGPRQLCSKDRRIDKQETCDWSGNSFEELKQLIAEKVPDGELQHYADTRITVHLDPAKDLPEEDEMAKVWAIQMSSSPAADLYETSLAEQWRKTGCSAEGAPYVLQKLLARLDNPSPPPFDEHSQEGPKLAAAFLDKDCAGARGLSEVEIATLKEIRDRTPPLAPKQ